MDNQPKSKRFDNGYFSSLFKQASFFIRWVRKAIYLVLLYSSTRYLIVEQHFQFWIKYLYISFGLSDV